MRVFFWSFTPIRSWASYDNGFYISLAHLWFSLLPAALARDSCRNDLILLDPFWAGRFIPFLSGLSQALFCFFLLMGSYVPLFSSFFLGIHGPFANPFGLPWPVC